MTVRVGSGSDGNFDAAATGADLPMGGEMETCIAIDDANDKQDGGTERRAVVPNNFNANNNHNNNNNNDEDDETIAARSLIARLQGDFRAEGKRTCRDCLRSKTLPCSRVTEVASELESGSYFHATTTSSSSSSSAAAAKRPIRALLARAHAILLREHAAVLPLPTETTEANRSALDCMNNISAALRLVQLLLRLSEKKPNPERRATPKTAPATKPAAAIAPLPEAETNAAVASLLRALTRGICEFLRTAAATHTNKEKTNDEATDSDSDNDNGNDNDNDEDGDGDNEVDGPTDLLLVDATRGLPPGPVFCYAFCSLVRMNEFVRTRGALLVPLWKGLSDLAEALVATNRCETGAADDNDDRNDNDGDNENGTEDWRVRLPPNLLGDAIRMLGNFLREGTEQLEVGAAKHGRNVSSSAPGTADGATHLVFQGKLVGFLVARMTHLARIWFSVRGGGNNNDSRADECSSRRAEEPVTDEIWRSLLGLRGMATALQILHSAEHTTETKVRVDDIDNGNGNGTANGNGNGNGNGIDLSILKVYCEIAAKAGQCVSGMVVQTANQNQNRGNPCRILTPALESLLRSTMVFGRGDLDSGNNTDNDSSRYRDCEERVRSRAKRLSELSKTTGKVLVLQQILQRMAAVADEAAAAAAGRDRGGDASFDTVESLLVTIEALHSIAVPQCLSAGIVAVRGEKGASAAPDPAGVTLPTTIVDGSLRIMVRTLRDIELSGALLASSSRRDSLHRLLVRWLAGSAGAARATPGFPAKARDDRYQQHPLAREMVLNLLQAHIVCCDVPHRGVGAASQKLLSLLTRLLMDSRTDSLLRGNIGALLIRLQSQSLANAATDACSAVSERTKRLVEQEFLAWLTQTATQSLESKKRKRKRTSPEESAKTGLDSDPGGVLVVSRVLGSGRELSADFSSSATRDCSRILRGEFSRLSSDCADEFVRSERALLAVAGRTSLLLAWLERTIAPGTKTSLDRFRGMTGLDPWTDVLQPALSVISSLKFQPGGADGAGMLRRKVLLYSAALRLSATAANAFGDGGKLPLEKVGLLIKHAMSKEAFQQERGDGTIDPAVLRDQHSILKGEVLNLLECIGRAIPSECSERVLRTIRRAFVSFLSSKDWAVVSLGISSVMVFGSQLNAAHQQILPQCLPRASMGFFQARASGQLWRGTDSDGNSNATEESVWQVVDRMADRLYICSANSDAADPKFQRKLTVRDVLPSTTTSTIAPGSYVLEMPTQEDRRATVVFPPGSQSLEDIRYMLGLDGDAPVPAQRLKRAMTTSRGGLKLWLLPP